MNIKPGFKSTEFYAFLIGLGSILYMAVTPYCHFDQSAILAIGGAVVTYVAGRSWVKAKANEPHLTPVPNA